MKRPNESLRGGLSEGVQQQVSALVLVLVLAIVIVLAFVCFTSAPPSRWARADALR
jgi:hypothetical protein